MYFEEELFMLIPMLFSSIPSALLGIGTYVLSSIALYIIARRRGLSNPWLAWIPLINCWIIGSLSDQYQYVVNGVNKSKRKILLALSILTLVFTVTIAVLSAVVVAGAMLRENVTGMMGPAMAILGLALPLAGVSIAMVVIRYMAMYDLYKSLDPSNAVLFLVLSIFFGVTEPFFLFFNRNRDEGMPPRKQPKLAYVEQAQEPSEQTQEPWETEEKNYL